MSWRSVRGFWSLGSGLISGLVRRWPELPRPHSIGRPWRGPNATSQTSKACEDGILTHTRHRHHHDRPDQNRPNPLRQTPTDYGGCWRCSRTSTSRIVRNGWPSGDGVSSGFRFPCLHGPLWITAGLRSPLVAIDLAPERLRWRLRRGRR
jgi:hypothetical protein